MTTRIPSLALSLLLMGTGSAHAAEFCVSDGAQLNAALIFAQGNGQSDLIRMTTGFFAFPGGGTFTYNPAVNSGETHGIEISGGWTTFFGNPCGQQFDTDAFSTVITGSSVRLLFMNMPISGANTSMTLRRLTFLAGGNGTGEGGGASLTALAGGFTGTLSVDQCAFLNNQANQAAGLAMRSGGGTVRLSNSLFRENHSTNAYSVYLQVASGVGVYATNNTIIDNTTDGTVAGMRISANGSSQALAANNNIWGNDGIGLSLFGLNTILRNNNTQSRNGAAPIEDTNNISVVPVYETGSLSYTPAAGSPLRDGGTKPSLFVPIPPRFEDGWIVGSVDVRSHPRLQGPKIDIGAYESDGDIIFRNGFDQ